MSFIPARVRVASKAKGGHSVVVICFLLSNCYLKKINQKEKISGKLSTYSCTVCGKSNK